MRALNRVLSVLLGLALLGGGLLVAAEVVAGALDRGELVIPARRWAVTLRDSAFSTNNAKLGFAAAGGLGLVLLIAQAWPRAPRRVALPGGERQSWWVLRRSLERHLGRSVVSGAGAIRANARVRPRRGKVKVRLAVEAPPPARDAVIERAGDQLARLLGEGRAQVALHLKYPKRVY